MRNVRETRGVVAREGSRARAGGDGSRYRLVGDLAQHLLTHYPVPEILASAWIGEPTEDRRLMQRWFIEHGGGVPLRKLGGLPLPLTRTMEHHFLQSPPHLPLRAALRRAEVLGLGAPEALADAITRTVLGRQTTDHGFWRPVLRFLVDHREALTEHRTVAIIDAIDELQPRLRALDGGALRPERLIRGRTPETLERTLAKLRSAWRSTQTATPKEEQRWSPTGIAGWTWLDTQSRVSWQIVELLGPRDLAQEGRQMKHCVGSYVGRCIRGTSRIWSLRWQCGDGTPEPRVTIEVSPQHRYVVQVRGPRNRRPPDAAVAMIRTWARSCGLTVAGSSGLG